MPKCYKCDREVKELSPRSRCVRCEYLSNQLNEVENEELRNTIEVWKEVAKGWKKTARAIQRLI